MSFTVPQVAPTPNTYAPTTLIGEQLINALGPWQTLHLAWYCDAIGACFEEVAQLVLDQGTDGDSDYIPGYGALFDPTKATGSQLAYLGQYVGVTVPAGTDDITARSMVDAEQGLKRGTEASIIAAAQRHLAGTQSVTPLWRTAPDGTPDGYWFILVVKPGELVDRLGLVAAVNAVKPVGVMWTLLVQDGFPWLTAINTWQQDSLSWAQAATQQP